MGFRRGRSNCYINYLPIWHLLISEICVIIIITCLGLADASWPQPKDDLLFPWER